MAVADLMVTALGQPLLVAFWGLQVNGDCNEPVSETFRVVGNMSCSASVLHLCFISIDRCIPIVRPLDCKSIRKRFKIAIAIAWAVSVTYGVLRMTVGKKATSYFTVIAAALCYLIIISCYTLIIVKVWNRGTETLKGSARGHARQGASHLVERRVTVTVAICCCSFHDLLDSTDVPS
ncbi:Melanocortin receptor 5 [Desmophyllum pertusum]|uniref:Melanocortin receptor 5 n=1 Tax=Desmophyllum pertusum TaxID=174260 RepID=A0A9X0CLV3_9CNID|nr:Melanocortin receptor 5 [Desmophyllum pertusum]